MYGLPYKREPQPERRKMRFETHVAIEPLTEVTGKPSGEAPVDSVSVMVPVTAVELRPEDPVDMVLDWADQMPAPQDGYAAFYSLLRENLRYPRKARQNRIEGRVFIQFIVGRDGALRDFRVIKRLGHGCDEGAIRVHRLSPWSPGKQRGVPVTVKMIQPIVLRLNY